MQMDATDMEEWCQTLKSIGMNTVEVAVYAQQGIWSSDDLTFSKPSAQSLSEIRTAKKAGMKVVLILRTELDYSHQENDFIWHGMIFPKTEDGLASWFSKYEQFTGMWAEVAEREGVDMLVLGSELNTLLATVPTDAFPPLELYYLDLAVQEKYMVNVRLRSKHLPPEVLESLAIPHYGDFGTSLFEEAKKKNAWANTTTFLGSANRIGAINQRRRLLHEHWVKVIQKARAVYSGKLSIAANFDSYRNLSIWSYLDCLSINAYFPLRRLSKPVENQMFDSWRQYLHEINTFRQASGIDDRPVFFTELGYTEYAGSTIYPWEGKGFSLVPDSRGDSLIYWPTQKRDLSERKRAVKALVKAVRNMDFPLQGILYWKFATGEFDIREDPFALSIKPDAPGEIQKMLVELID